MPEEGAMAAIMLNGEQPHQEGAGRQGERQGQPVADIKGRPRQHPEGGQWNDREGDLEDAPGSAGLPVTREDLGPGSGLHRGRRLDRAVFIASQSGNLPAHSPRRGLRRTIGFRRRRRWRQRDESSVAGSDGGRGGCLKAGLDDAGSAGSWGRRRA